MNDHSLRVALCRSITARAHLAGAEALYLNEAGHCDEAQSTRRRYWREVSAAARLSGMPWPEAEALGVDQ
jgi:hypothetical protein